MNLKGSQSFTRLGMGGGANAQLIVEAFFKS